MEQKIVPISHEDSQKVEALFARCNTYMSMVGFLGAQYGMSEQMPLFNEKWNETVELYMQLEALKAEMDSKYRPESGNWTNYMFDFRKDQMVYTNDTEL